MNRDKAPDPDGLTLGFYKDHWPTIKSGLLNFIQSFFDTTDLYPVLNHTHICLIFNVENPTEVKDYRPISLSNVAHKILSKLLSDRVKPLLHNSSLNIK